MARNLYNIEKEFENLIRNMNRTWDDFFIHSSEESLLPFQNRGIIDVSFKTPKTDIMETENEIVAEIEVPGVDKKDIKLEIKNGVLYLKAETKFEKEEKSSKKGFHRIERNYHGFMRSFSLPAEVDEKKVKATYEDGILKVRMQKIKEKENSKHKYITIS